MQHDGLVSALAFDPAGKVLASGSWDMTVRLWDVETGRPLVAPMGPRPDRPGSGPGARSLRHPAPLRLAAISPGGKVVTTVGQDDTVRFWDAATGRSLGEWSPEARSVIHIGYSRDGKILAVAGMSPIVVSRWDVAQGRPLGPSWRPGGGMQVSAMGVSPEGRTVALAMPDHRVLTWDFDAGALAGAPIVLSGPLKALAIRPDGVALATAGPDRLARLWAITTGKALGPPLVHQESVRIIAFEQGGETLLTATSDGRIRFWAPESGAARGRRVASPNLWNLAVSPDGTMLAAATMSEVQLRHLPTGRPLGPPWSTRRALLELAFRPDGTALTTVAHDKSLVTWPVPTPMLGDAQLIGHAIRASTGLEFEPDDSIRAASAEEWARHREQARNMPGP
jgi:WD40 repeat protein